MRVTTAVNVTLPPKVDGLDDEDTAVTVATLAATVCTTAQARLQRRTAAPEPAVARPDGHTIGEEGGRRARLARAVECDTSGGPELRAGIPRAVGAAIVELHRPLRDRRATRDDGRVAVTLSPGADGFGLVLTVVVVSAASVNVTCARDLLPVAVR